MMGKLEINERDGYPHWYGRKFVRNRSVVASRVPKVRQTPVRIV